MILSSIETSLQTHKWLNPKDLKTFNLLLKKAQTSPAKQSQNRDPALGCTVIWFTPFTGKSNYCHLWVLLTFKITKIGWIACICHLSKQSATISIRWNRFLFNPRIIARRVQNQTLIIIALELNRTKDLINHLAMLAMYRSKQIGFFLTSGAIFLLCPIRNFASTRSIFFCGIVGTPASKKILFYVHRLLWIFLEDQVHFLFRSLSQPQLSYRQFSIFLEIYSSFFPIWVNSQWRCFSYRTDVFFL